MGGFVPSDVDLDRDRLLDISVNIIPIAIMVFFVVLFVVVTPFTPDRFMLVLSLFLVVVPIGLLGVLTYVSAKVIGRDEQLPGSEMDGSVSGVAEARTEDRTGAGPSRERD